MAKRRAARRGQNKGGPPTKFGSKMVKVTLMMPQEGIDALKISAKESGFTAWTEQLRFEALEPRGLYKRLAPSPVLPGRRVTVEDASKQPV